MYFTTFSHLSLFNISISPQEQTQIHQSASPNHQRSQRAVGLGPMSALSVMRIWWTRSSTPVDTCVCATPAASNSRRCPTPAAPSAEGRSKTLSRPTGARRGTDGQTDSLGTAESQSPGKKRLCSGKWTLVLSFRIFTRVLLVGSLEWLFPKQVLLYLKGLFHLIVAVTISLQRWHLMWQWFSTENLILCSLSPMILEDFEGEKLNLFQNDFISGAMLKM